MGFNVCKFDFKNDRHKWSNQYVISQDGDFYTCLVGDTIIQYHKNEIVLKDELRFVSYKDRAETKSELNKLQTRLENVEKRISDIQNRMKNSKSLSEHNAVSEELEDLCYESATLEGNIDELKYRIEVR